MSRQAVKSIIFNLAILFSCFFLSPEFVSAKTKGYWKEDTRYLLGVSNVPSLRIRKAPNAESEHIATLHQGHQVFIVGERGEKGDWYKIFAP